MQHRLSELLEFIIQEIADAPALSGHGDEIRQRLADKGYEQNEIDDALQMIHAASATLVSGPVADSREETRPEKCRTTYRVLSLWERAKLTVDAQQQLMRLERTGLLSPGERETVIERAMQADGLVDGPEINVLAAWTVLPGGGVSRQRILLDLIGETDSETISVH